MAYQMSSTRADAGLCYHAGLPAVLHPHYKNRFSQIPDIFGIVGSGYGISSLAALRSGQ